VTPGLPHHRAYSLEEGDQALFPVKLLRFTACTGLPQRTSILPFGNDSGYHTAAKDYRLLGGLDNMGRRNLLVIGENMAEQITLQVSEQVMRHGMHIATQTCQRLEDVLAAWLERTVMEIPVEELSDTDILALLDLQLSEEQQTTLSHLLSQNREGQLNVAGRRQLDTLMQVYEQGLLRKAQALRIAVQRGLREPLQP